MYENISPTEHIRQLFEQRRQLSDHAILAELVALPVLPDEQDPAWQDQRTWYDLADRFIALADVAAQRRLRAAIPLLLERASYGDPGEIMRGLRHRLEAIANPNWQDLSEICMHMAHAPQSGARLWSIDELGIVRDPRALPTLIAALNDRADGVRTTACRSLAMICERYPAGRPIALEALQQYLEQHPSKEEQRAGQEAIGSIQSIE